MMTPRIVSESIFGSTIVHFVSTVLDWSSVDASVSGRFCHPTLEERKGDPIYGHTIELYAKTFFGEKLLAKTKTDKDGKFEFKYRQYSKSFTQNQELIIKVKKVADKGLLAWIRPVLDTETITKKYSDIKFFLKNDLIATVLEYNRKPDTIPEDLENIEQLPTPDDLWFGRTGVEAFFPSVLDTAAAKLEIGPFSGVKTLDDLKKLHNLPNETKKLTDDDVLDMIKTGIGALPFKKGNNEGECVVEVKWNPKSIDLSPNAPDVPNLELTLKETEKGLEILSVKIQRLKKQTELEKVEENQDGIEVIYLENEEIQFEKDIYDTWVYKNGDKEWDRVLQTLMCILFMVGELRKHLTYSHLNAGVTTFAGNRCFIDSPFKELLDPSDEGVSLVNALGKDLIFAGKEKDKKNSGGVLSIMGLSTTGIHDEIVEGMKETLSKKTTDTESRFSNDIFAERADLTYETFLSGVLAFMKNKMDDILKTWYEVFYFFKNIRENRLEKDGWSFPDIAMDVDKPNETDWNDVAHWFANYMYLASQGHNAPHSAQWIGLNPAVTLAPRLDKDGLVTGPTSGATLEELDRQFRIAKVLLAFNNHKRMESKSIINHPDVVDEVKISFKNEMDKFSNLGIDLKKEPPISIYI